MRWTVLVRGPAGHPLHPPLTDATIGAFTVGTIAAALAWFGVLEDVLVPTAVAALVIGLAFAVPTAITGLADLLAIDEDAPARLVGLVHLGLMTLAATGFFVAVLLLLPSLEEEVVSTSATAVAVVSFAVMTVGGWVGGSLAYVYGVRVLGASDTPPDRALRPHLTGEGDVEDVEDALDPGRG